MKIVVAPDSFKGCLSSPQVCEHIATAIKKVMPDAEVIKLPLADGGEGTTATIVAATNGKLCQVEVTDAIGNPITVAYGLINNGKTAVMEMAAASGIERLLPDKLAPLRASTYGSGLLLRHIIDAGLRDIIIGIGGSATNDGGAGLLQALGYRFINRQGEYLPNGIGGGELQQIADIDAAEVIPELAECRIRVACDVTNPLLGPNGAIRVYGPQKGATAKDIELLEAGMKNYATVVFRHLGKAEEAYPGDGAAGGLGFCLRTMLKAEILPGASLLIDIIRLRQHLEQCDWLITGEGCTDRQTASGKLCAAVADVAQEYGVPVILLSGAVTCPLELLQQKFLAAFSIADRPMSLETALERAGENLTKQAGNIARLLAKLSSN